MIELYEQCLTLARIVAKPYSYAVAVHGSAQRDLDLVAVPWTDEAGDPAKLILAMIAAFEFEFGDNNVCVHPGDLAALRAKADGTVKESSWPSTMTKPHGRAAMTIGVRGYFVDLSIMPRREAA